MEQSKYTIIDSTTGEVIVRVGEFMTIEVKEAITHAMLDLEYMRILDASDNVVHAETK